MKLAPPRTPESTGAESSPTQKNRVRKVSLPDPGPCSSSRQPQTITRDRALFHINSVVIQVWLMQLRKRIQANYTRQNKRGRSELQSGYAWRSFSTFFEPLSAIELVRLFENLLRFASFDGYPPSRAIFLAYAPLAFEHDISGEYIGPGVWSPPLGSNRAVRRVRRTLQRWCDWLEALVHFQVDREYNQFARYHEMNKATILLWPLVKRYNWSAEDLLNLLKSLRGFRSPFASPQEFATYSDRFLALRFRRAEKNSSNGPFRGQELAFRLLKFLSAIS